MEETNVDSGPVDPKLADEEMVEAEHQPASSVPQPKAASDSDSESDSDDDSADEAKEALQIETLENELANNPANYEAHVEYIRTLRKKGEIEKLRQAREAMNALFPLSPAMWQDWAKDEISLSSGSESLSAIENLYERGIYDYLSIPLWCDYLNFVKEHDPAVREYSPLGISKARNLFERALTCGGLHAKEGSKIWEAYREFEVDILKNIDGADAEAREKQVQLIRNLFHRQLSVPHCDLRLTLLAYKSWEVEQGSTIDAKSSGVDGISSNVASSYQKALDMLDARAHFEEQISKPDLSDIERLQDYMAYLKFEQSSGDPARVQILYERAVTEFPISNDLWLDYTSYLDKTLKAASIVRDVYSRATRNCPWVGELWVRYLLSVERGRASEEEISTVFEKALLCTFSTFDEYLDIFLTRIDGLRRRISQSDQLEDSFDMTLMRETFQRASDYLSPHLKGTDSLLRLHAYWARLELDLGRNTVAARGVWESFLKTSGSMLEAWQGYISMEVGMKNINEARSLYRRSYSKRFSGTGSEDICHSWLRFEREFGTLEDLDHAIHKVTPRLRELQLFRLQEESKNIAAVANQDTSTKKIAREKRKHSDTAAEQPKPKRQKDKAANAKKAQREDKSQEERSNHTNKGENVPLDGRSSRAQGNEHRGSSPVKQKFSDQCTVFMSNLSLKATADDLHRFFSDVGGVVAVRILKDKYTGTSRGLAYVDFSDEAHLKAAVAKNRQTLLGKRLSIARSDPKKLKTREAVVRNPPADHGQPNGQSSADGESEAVPKDSSDSQKATEESAPRQRGGNSNVQLKGKNTFAVPRAVKPLGWSARNQPKVKRVEEGDEEDQKPKSNDEFRNMFLKK